MIEVEKKVALQEADLRTIEKLGTFLGCKIISDTYYDTADFRYTKGDIWLRERECTFELKVGVRGYDGGIDHYEEITDEMQILRKLGLEKDKDFLKALSKAKIYPFATLQTVRRKYQIEEFFIDLDLAYFDDFIYRIAEIELRVANESKIPQAEDAINLFIQRLGIDPDRPIKAKLIEFLIQKNPTHYEALISSGVVK